jgi:hypothetical protein
VPGRQRPNFAAGDANPLKSDGFDFREDPLQIGVKPTHGRAF